MKARLAEQPPSAIGPDEVRRTLERVLNSKHFVNAHKKKDFLRLICGFYLEGRAQELSELILGYSVFERGSSYNPSDDPIVRVFAHQIRKKLEAYYRSEGANDPIRLEIPAGSYQPVFVRHSLEPKAEPFEAAPSAHPGTEVVPARRHFSTGKMAAILMGSCLAIAVFVLAMSNGQLRQQVAEAEIAKDPATYGAVWTTFLTDNNPPLVILSNLPGFRFANPGDPEALSENSIPLNAEAAEALKGKFVTNQEVSIKVSDRSVADIAKSRTDRVISEPSQTPGQTPRLILNENIYTEMGEAIGLHYLTDFFRKAGRSILLKQSRTLSAEDLKKHNVILLGNVGGNEWSSKLARSEDFTFTSKATIENQNPQPGEDREYIPQFDRRTGNLIVDYALITVQPNISAANEVMLLAGVYSQGTEAAAEFVTNKNYLDQLNQRLQQSGRPPYYFQALLKVGVENGIPAVISILALHELRVAEPYKSSHK